MNVIDLRALLADHLQAGVYFVDVRDTEAMAEAGMALDYAVVRIDLGGCADKAEALRRFAQALRFPTWFGGNWDALADSLGDMAWWPADGYLLLIEHAGAWRTQAREEFDTLLAILNDNAVAWAGRDTAFWALLPLPAERLAELDN